LGISPTLELDVLRVDASTAGFDAVILHSAIEDSHLAI
jgi:hypothetical protein